MSRLPKSLEQIRDELADKRAKQYEVDYYDRYSNAQQMFDSGALQVKQRADKLAEVAKQCIPPEAYGPKAEGTAVGNLVKEITEWDEFWRGRE